MKTHLQPTGFGSNFEIAILENVRCRFCNRFVLTLRYLLRVRFEYSIWLSENTTTCSWFHENAQAMRSAAQWTIPKKGILWQRVNCRVALQDPSAILGLISSGRIEPVRWARTAQLQEKLWSLSDENWSLNRMTSILLICRISKLMRGGECSKKSTSKKISDMSMDFRVLL
jgi:hypothetical protein